MTPQTEGQKFKSQIARRVLLILGLGCAWVVAIVVQLLNLQALEADDYRNKAQAQQQGYFDITPKRGDILDRHLESLASTVRADSIFCQPQDVEQPELVAQKLSGILEIPAKELASKLTSDTSFIYLKRKAPPHVAQKIRDLGLKGIYTHEESRRVYPNRSLASHLLGFVGIDDNGLGGLEYLYDKQLRGTKGRVHLTFDGKRKSYSRNDVEGETEGNILVLSIDRTLQHIAETSLKESVEKFSAANGSVILMDPSTGEVLALASYPDFNPNDYSDSSAEERRNRTILDTYEPGSTFKILTLAAAINEGIVSRDTVIDCSPGSARLGRKVYKEAKTSFGLLTVEEILAKSSNIGTVQIGVELGAERLHDYVSRFEFGQKTGIELPGEEAGLFRPLRNWSKISIGAVSIGQEIGVTPVQLVRAVASIANGGYLVQPILLKKVLSPAGDLLYSSEVQKKKILERQTAETVKSMLTSVVTSGTGRTAALKGYSSAGKTGTAQKIVDGKYSHSKYVASFIGFAPADNPALLALVVINEPHGIPYGGHVAGPAFKQIMERALIHLGVPQDEPVEIPGFDQASLEPDKGLQLQASRPLPERRNLAQVEEIPAMDGLEEAMNALMERGSLPQPPSAVAWKEVGAQAVLPNFSGRSLREVVQDSARLEIRLKLTGSGFAVGQRPEPGTTIIKDMVCEVFFSTDGKGANAPARVALRSEREIASGN